MRVKDAVAACLTEASGQYLSGETLAQKLGVSRNAVWKAVRLLQDEGFPIEAKKKTGYRLAQGVDLLTEESVPPVSAQPDSGTPVIRLFRNWAPPTTPAKRWCGIMPDTARWWRQTARLPEKADKDALLYPRPVPGCISLMILRPRRPALSGCAAPDGLRRRRRRHEPLTLCTARRSQIKWVNDLYPGRQEAAAAFSPRAVASLESGQAGTGQSSASASTSATPRPLATPEELRRTCHLASRRPVPDMSRQAGPSCSAAVLCELEQLLPELPPAAVSCAEYRTRSCLIGADRGTDRDDRRQLSKKAAVAGDRRRLRSGRAGQLRQRGNPPRRRSAHRCEGITGIIGA